MDHAVLVLNVLKVFGLGSLAFFVGFAWTPFLLRSFHRHKAWPKTMPREKAVTGESATVVHAQESRMQASRDDAPVPRLGGIVIWGTVVIVTLVMWALSLVIPNNLTLKLNFLSRNQTWLPLFALVAASIIGLVDDLARIKNTGGYIAGGLELRKRIGLVMIIGLIAAFWFHNQLGMSSINIPFWGDLQLGWLYVPVFIVVLIGTFSTGIIDGIDGLAGGVFASIFAAFLGITIVRQQIDLATFIAVLIGSLLAFLWHNIPPAQYYMGETGILGLTTVLTLIAFFTDSVAVLPIIALPLVMTSVSAILQIFWKRFLGRKLFIAAPLHHHLEARGWTRAQITMRYWIFGTIVALMGMVIAAIG